ncbi:MAG: Ppx/GppA family phosphatase [Campylobacterales bacterium]|nr:Ppx/GppA family phosphatase [Campylobacterales bacterium]
MELEKHTAVIDIGSNSARLVIFERSSKFGFHIISEQKSRVRIGEGAYQNEGKLQSIGITRAYQALDSFMQTIREYDVTHIECVATSALRDAPNAGKFIDWIKSNIGIDINVIDGDKEAFYGSIAAMNLLPIESGITVDIGGGSADMSLIESGKIVDTISLNLGGVRLKELFRDRGKSIEEMQSFVAKELQRIPPHFYNKSAIGMGGTIRALSKAIMIKESYPLKKLHAFSYELDAQINYFERVINSDIEGLKFYYLKEDRFDTIREGTLIFVSILKAIKAKEVITSGVGVREGIFLSKMLKNYDYRFPAPINPSIISMQDRFDKTLKRYESMIHSALKLYALLRKNLRMESDKDYSVELISAIKLSNIGKSLTIYHANEHAFYIALQELNYKYRHEPIILISMLLLMQGKDIKKSSPYRLYRDLLPKKSTFKLLNFCYALSIALYEDAKEAVIDFEYRQSTLTIRSDRSLYLSKNSIYKIAKPKKFEIKIIDASAIPPIDGIVG